MKTNNKKLLWQKYLTREYSFLYISYAIDCYKIMHQTVGTTITYDISQGEGKIVSLYGIKEDIMHSYEMIEEIAKKDPQEIVRKMARFDELIKSNYELFAEIKKAKTKKQLRNLLKQLDAIFLETLCYYLFFVFLGYAGDLPHIKKFLEKNGDRFHKIRLYTIDADMDREFPKLFALYDINLLKLASYMWRDELLDFIDDKPINLQRIKNRKKKYLVITKAEKTKEYDYKKIAKITTQELAHLENSLLNYCKGQIAYRGSTTGQVVVVRSLDDYAKIKNGDIIVAPMIKPAIIPFLTDIKGIVTDDSGMHSHAAIIAKKLQIPCIVGTKNATELFKDRETVFLDAIKGLTSKQVQLKGRIAFKGKATGRVTIVLTAKDYNKIKEGDILVTPMTKPSIVSYLTQVTGIITDDGENFIKKTVKGIVTDDGGALSHASIISREMQIPCIVGTGNATKVLKDGQNIEVDADNGTVKILQ
jgi:phosphoenolpyruvate synthase/pyruvate phosphate dikinase